MAYTNSELLAQYNAAYKHKYYCSYYFGGDCFCGMTYEEAVEAVYPDNPQECGEEECEKVEPETKDSSVDVDDDIPF